MRALALLLHAGAVLSARHEFGRTCELHDLDERPTGLWRVFPDLRWLWSGSPNAAEEIRVSKERRRRLSEWTGTFASDCVNLNLFGDQLTLRQVEGVAASLPDHPRLTHLQLRNTSIGDASATCRTSTRRGARRCASGPTRAASTRSTPTSTPPRASRRWPRTTRSPKG